MGISAYHIRQYRSPYESTRALIRFIEECVGPLNGRAVLDVACGGGANIMHMARRWPGARFVGLDLNREAIAYARKRLPKSLRRYAIFRQGNLLDLPKYYSPKHFEISVFMQTLLLFEREKYPRVLQSIFHVTRSWVFLNSLFTDSEMDVESRIHLYAHSDEYPNGRVSYNTFSVSRFSRVCKQLGAKELVWREFAIPIDLPRPRSGGLGTYTIKTAHGERLQFSGCVYMPWKIVGIRLGK